MSKITFSDLPADQVRASGRYGTAVRWRKHYERKLAEARAREADAWTELSRTRSRQAEETANA